MMSEQPLTKRPKIEVEENGKEGAKSGNSNFAEQIESGEEEILSVLIEHRTKEVEHLRQRVDYYQSKLDHTERALEQTKTKLAHLRGCEVVKDSEKSVVANERRDVNFETCSASPTNIRQKPPGDSSKSGKKRSSSPLNRDEEPTEKQLQPKPRPVVPSLLPNTSQTVVKAKESANKVASGANTKGDKAQRQSKETFESRSKETKAKPVQKEHKDLIPLIAKSSAPVPIRCQSGCLLSSRHNRKLRCLALCPTNDQLFVTSALDGAINLWQVQGKGSTANLLSTTDCQSEKQRRWPEDLAFHPLGKKIISVYTADGGDAQISVLDLNKGKEKTRVKFLKEKPHTKGIINSVSFMPWDGPSFVTGGSDHAVIIWKGEGEGEEECWKPKSLHRNFHSSAVMGIAGMIHKSVVMSVGADKRILGFDVQSGRTDYTHQIDSKCMSILPNPSDFNLFMVQTGTPEKQLRLFDRRLRQMEVHAFGWKQESSESQSALVNQSWSPDGLYITSGSADPIIHVFDIRQNARRPSQSIKAHHKRVFKAAWHHALPLLVSISSDLNIGLHKIV